MRLYHTPHLGRSNNNSHMRDKDQEVGVVSIIIEIAKVIGNTLIHNNIVTVSLSLVVIETTQNETEGIEITQNEIEEEIEIII